MFWLGFFLNDSFAKMMMELLVSSPEVVNQPLVEFFQEQILKPLSSRYAEIALFIGESLDDLVVALVDHLPGVPGAVPAHVGGGAAQAGEVVRGTHFESFILQANTFVRNDCRVANGSMVRLELVGGNRENLKTT